MNKFTADFHQGTFPGLALSTPFQEISDNFWFSTGVPFVETDFNIDATASHQWLVEHDHLFEAQYSQVNRLNFAKEQGYDWFTDVHSSGWSVINLFGYEYPHASIVPRGENHIQPCQLRMQPSAVPDLIVQLDRINLPVTKITIFRLEPGGWVQPHLDKKVPNVPVMNHMWMPLNESSPSLKIYPCGYIHHQVGRAYLLNNSNFVHSLINIDENPRYVAIMKLDYQRLSNESMTRIRQSLYQQWYDPGLSNLVKNHNVQS